ncbi:MAG: alkaline phosphatase [Alistipes sp.]|nr:alkaline phosphatase [Alistipes sp.]
MKNIFRQAVRTAAAVLLTAGVMPAAAAPPEYGKPYRTEVSPTRNLIVMIPDGTSLGVLSAARWYRYYNGGEARLAVDDYICGTVRSFASNSLIADSAPGGSAFFTGVPPRTKNIAVYPEADPGNDIFEVDPAMAYRPLATLLEAARITQDKATGLVVKVEFPHATPAGASAHTANRNSYGIIASQMAHQDLDVMLGGGLECITPEIERYLESNGTRLLADDIDGFRSHDSGRLWALWCDYNFPYVHDHDGGRIPLLPEMTRKALDLLSQNENGFFLMVEGSMVDWAAHSNDAVGIITEFLEFDDAVRVAMDFAREDGNTTVVIVPDHGNAGFTIGNYRLKGYDTTPVAEIYEPVSKFLKTSDGVEAVLMESDTTRYAEIFHELTGIRLTDDETLQLVRLRGIKAGDYMTVGYSENMHGFIARKMNEAHYFGYTSGGHTGEDVFLAAYHPAGNLPLGVNTNTELNNYMADAMGLDRRLPELSAALFVPHTEVFEGDRYSVGFDNGRREDFPTLTVRAGDRTVEIPGQTSVALVDGEMVSLGSVAVYMPETGLFYLPADFKERFLR